MDRLFSIEGLEHGILENELSTFGGDKSIAIQLARQLADTMRKNGRLLRAVKKLMDEDCRDCQECAVYKSESWKELEALSNKDSEHDN